jgi:hypothetical protein
MFSWRSANDLLEQSRLGIDPRYRSDKYLSMRLLRYYRAGLLKRRRHGKGYEYTLTHRGSDRLIFLWNKFNMLTPPPGWEFRGELGRLEKELADRRREFAVMLLEEKQQRLISERAERRQDYLRLLSSMSSRG